MNEFTPRFDPMTGEPLVQQPERYGLTEIVFAWLTLLAGYGFCRVFPVTDHPFGGFLYIVALFTATAVLLRCRGASFGALPIVMGGSAVLLSAALFLSANGLIHFLVYLYALAVWFYFVSGSCGNLLERGWSELMLADFFKSFFVMPFASFGKLFPVLFSRGKGKGRSVLKILLGLGIAVLPTVVIVALLSYDASFMKLFNRIFDLSWRNVFSHLFSLMLGVPIGMFLYGAFFSAHKNKCKDVFTAEDHAAISRKIKILPGLTAVAATLPILAVYGIFFASQWRYYLSPFTGVLPENFTFAEYARAGFFQLCAVSVINLVILVLMQLFIRRKEESRGAVTRVLSVLFSVATLVLIATAIAKLWLYIDRFGLTPKRVYAGWFMVILAVLFLLVLLKQVIRKFKLIPTATVVCVVLFGVLALSGSDTLIAEYNVDRYLVGTLETVDVSAMEDLGDAAVPALVRLAEKMDAQNGTDIRNFEKDTEDDLYNEVASYLYLCAEEEPHTLFSFTVPRIRAERALAQAEIVPTE